MSVALISVTVVNLLVSPLTIFLNVLIILAVKTTPQLRDEYNALLACLAGTGIMTGALGQPLFIAEQIYRLTGSPGIRVFHHSIRCKTLHWNIPYELATPFDVDKHRAVYIDKIPFYTVD